MRLELIQASIMNKLLVDDFAHAAEGAICLNEALGL